MPEFSARAAAIAAFLFLANTLPPRPYLLSLASLTPSARLVTGVTVMVGPKVSSVTAVLDSGTSARMTGPTYGLRMLPSPPTTARPPQAIASAMCCSMISAWPGIVIGP